MKTNQNKMNNPDSLKSITTQHCKMLHKIVLLHLHCYGGYQYILW